MKKKKLALMPKYSPFRYPGGKSWFVPRLRQWMREAQPYFFVEPFAGGASASCTVALENLAPFVILNELDTQVYAVWRMVFSQHAEELCQRILSFDMNRENALSVVASAPIDLMDTAFRTIVQNRVSHGGVIAPGGGVLNSGEDGKGVMSRWYPQTLAKRIRGLAEVRHKVTVTNEDALDMLNEIAGFVDFSVFIDPPYTAGGKNAGSRLYTHHQIDHEALFRAAARLADPIMTYDLNDEVIEMAGRWGLITKPIAMKNTRHALMDELLIGRRLEWDNPDTRPAPQSRKIPKSQQPDAATKLITSTECEPLLATSKPPTDESPAIPLLSGF